MPFARITKNKRRYRLPAVVIAGSGLVIALGALVSASPALAGQSTPKVNANATALKTPRWSNAMHIVNDPAAYARAARSPDWIRTPEGLAYKTCVYHMPAHARIDYDTFVYSNGTRRRMAPCTHPTLAYPAGSTAGVAQTASSSLSAATAGTPADLALWTWESPAYLIFLSERFSIPSNPSKSGALMFFWPAFEQGPNPNDCCILQPVLTWGANGNVTNPNIWYITAWYGVNGRYVPSGSIHVQPTQTVDGTISGQSCSSSGACSWTVTAGVEGGNSVSIQMNTPPLFQVDGGAMELYEPISSCAELPQGGHEAFRNLDVVNWNGTMPSTTKFGSYSSNYCSAKVLSGLATGGDITWTTSGSP
jgi:hypothetical protein